MDDDSGATGCGIVLGIILALPLFIEASPNEDRVLVGKMPVNIPAQARGCAVAG